MSTCNAATTDRLSGCLAQCILPQGHDGDHTDGGGMTWGFRAHDLDIDNSNSHISRLLRGKLPPPPTEEEIVERTRRDTYKNILAGLGVDYEEDASATTLLLQVNAEVERAAELRDAARAVVEALTSPFCTPHRHCRHQDCRSVALWWSVNATCFCDDHRPTGTPLTESIYAPAWRRFCALVEGK